MLSLFLSVDEPPATFAAVSEGHLFYAPDARGPGDLHTRGREALLARLLDRFPIAAEAPSAVDEFLAERRAETRREADHAESAAELWPRTRAAGLSLADRACLALARHHGVPALTADRAWCDVDAGVEVLIVR